MLADRRSLENKKKNNAYHTNDLNGNNSKYNKDFEGSIGSYSSSSISSTVCSICDSRGYIDSWRTVACYFCNGTGEYTKAAVSFMRIHPCQCIQTDRRNCPLCKQKCHHSSNNKPKVLVVKSPP
jgi:hypothetical protein